MLVPSATPFWDYIIQISLHSCRALDCTRMSIAAFFFYVRSQQHIPMFLLSFLFIVLKYMYHDNVHFKYLQPHNSGNINYSHNIYTQNTFISSIKLCTY